jgi:prepilin-type N-terminal cleavage/methylation domain-containing protein
VFLRSKRRSSGFSLLELGIVIAIVAIVAVMIVPILATIRRRAQRVNCANNLRNLSVGANLFVQQNSSWPQIPPAGATGSQEEHAEAWISALAPFGPTRETWICPAIQNLLNNPDYKATENARIDYIATSFDDKPATPYEWPRQPWFIETGDVHGNGNLIIFTDGSISDLKTVVKEMANQ